MAQSWGSKLMSIVGEAVGKALRQEINKRTRSSSRSRRSSGSSTTGRGTKKKPTPRSSSSGGARPGAGGSRSVGPTAPDHYPGDFVGPFSISYAPQLDDRPDPGEVVWAWVPFEEDHSQGKDRPVLLLARDGSWLLGVPLTSKDHDRDEAQEASQGRHWIDVGSGDWDSQRRPSEARLDRVVRVDPARVRRVGAQLDEQRFTMVAQAVLQYR